MKNLTNEPLLFTTQKITKHLQNVSVFANMNWKYN